MAQFPVKAMREFMRQIGKKGGKARAAKYDKETRSKWAKLGGRPRKIIPEEVMQ